MRNCLILFYFVSCFSAFAESSKQLNIVFLAVGAEQRKALIQLVEGFTQKNPEIKVSHRTVENEHYKATFSKRLASKDSGDLLYWFAGEQLNRFVHNNLIEDISDVWQQVDGAHRFSAVSGSAVTINNKVYALPVAYYQWGFYYRKSLFKQLQMQPPKNWPAFIKILKTLKSHNITPIMLGAKHKWPLGSWFDYLNLRQNGVEFHRKTTRGEISFLSAEMRQLFQTMAEFTKAGYFNNNARSIDWRETLPLIYRDYAAMTLMGNFITPYIADDVKDDFGFFPFPQISSAIGRYEEAPLDVVLIPKNAKNKNNAKAFLRYLSEHDVQLNIARQLNLISPLKTAADASDKFIKAGIALLATADDITFYLDRDAPQTLNNAILTALYETLSTPEQLPKILQHLENKRLHYLTDNANLTKR